MLAQNIVNNHMSARKKMREKNCNSEKKIEPLEIYELKLSEI